MDHEHTRLLEDVIRVSVMADDEEQAREKAADYAHRNGFHGDPEIMDVFQNPHLERSYAVYCTAVYPPGER